MIGSSKNNRQNYPRKCFWTQEKETRVKFNPGLSANRPSNNWAQVFKLLAWGGRPPWGLHTPFLTENVPAFHIPSTDKWYPFLIPSLEPCICTIFLIWIKQAVFLSLSHLWNVPFSPFWSFQIPRDFPTLLTYSNVWKPYPFIYENPEKGTPFCWSLPYRPL